MFVCTTVDNKPIAIAKSIVGTVEQTVSGGCKITTTLVKSPYQGHVENIVYVVKEPIQFVIGAMRK